MPLSRSDEGGGPVFRPASFGLARMAALPAEYAVATRAELAPENDGDGRQLAGHLLDLIKDPVVREAIEVSSTSLAHTIDRIEEGESVEHAKLERAALAATRYVLRMTGRPTPFGLLAGVQSVSFGDDTDVRVGNRHSKYARADSAWLSGVLATLRHEPHVREALTLVTNNFCRVRGDRLVLPYVRSTDETRPDHPTHEVSIGYTPVVRAAVEAARHPIAVADLKRGVQERFPDAATGDIDRLLTQLIDREILLTDLDARQDRPDQLAYVNEKLAGVETATTTELRRVEDLIAEYSSSASGEGRAAWNAAVTAMRGVHPGGQPPIQVDLRVDADVHLPDELADEVARTADVLWRLAPAGVSPQLRDYHQRFLDRYGTDEIIPLPELVDPHHGLGVPAGYRVPPSDRAAAAEPETSYPQSRDELLGHAVHALGSGGELVLDDDLVARLSPEEDIPPPASLDLCVQPLARSLDALRRGDFELIVGGVGHSAGSLAGRFVHTAGAQRSIAALYGESGEEPDDDTPLAVQLFFQPLSARSGNIARVPRLAPHAVAVGCFPDADDALDPADLAVGASLDRFYLVSATTGREVRIARPHLLNMLTEAPNAARLLAALSDHGVRPCTPWQWGRLDALPHLPRVRYGRSVLALARWRADPALCDPSLSWSAWQRALEEWRERLRVPEQVRVSTFDHRLDLDLTVPLHRRLLRAQLRGQRGPVLQEVPVTRASELGWSDGHATEVAVPLTSTRSRSPAPRMPAQPGARARHTPGGEWLYAKIYAARDLHERLLARDIPRLLDQVAESADRWFFVRYADPDPHLRLRLHGTPEQLNTRVLPALHEWAQAACAGGVIRKLVLDTYEPESIRYGGPAAIELAERLFHADSAAAVAQLRAQARGDLAVPVETLAAMNYVELLDGLGAWDWWQWVLDSFSTDVQSNVTAARRREAVALVDPERRWEAASELGGADDLFAHWPARTDAARAYGSALGIGASGTAPANGHSSVILSLLHMHANRLFGPNNNAEQRSYGILRSVVRNHLGRVRYRG